MDACALFSVPTNQILNLHFSQVIQESGNQGASDSGRSDFMDVVERGVTTSPCEVFNWADFGPFIVSERP